MGTLVWTPPRPERGGGDDGPRIRHLGQCSLIPDAQPSRSPSRSELPGLSGTILSPVAPVAGTLDILAPVLGDEQTLKKTSPIRPDLELSAVSVPRRTTRFMSTAVPRFNGDACWYQHQQVFDAIAKSNGWDDETAALQLFAYLRGEPLDVALPTPEDQRVTRSRLTGALSDYYSSPGRLAIYRRRFESAVQRDEEDTSKFATELETLASRGFGNAGPGARTRIVRDQFVAGHGDCELRRHLR